MPADEGILRQATTADWSSAKDLWAVSFQSDGQPGVDRWSASVAQWFARAVDEPDAATIPVIEVAGRIVAIAVGTLAIGVPNPWCLRGRAVHLENLCTRPQERGRGYATMLVLEVVAWARRIDADRVDLSTTPQGRRIYDRAGFVQTSAPRMKLVL